MLERTCDVAVVGGGPAGLAAAAAAREEGAERVLVIERDSSLGGILQQCIHPGFGLAYYNEELTGPEYAARFVQRAREQGVETLLDSMVLEVEPNGTVHCTSARDGITAVHAKSVVLAMGCRERTRGGIRIPGTRPAGVYTAGTAQRLMNRQNEMVGKRVVILGSGDIGMIMARRMTLEGAHVVAVVELMDYPAGLKRNQIQCLDDFDIPLLLSHTVTRVVGNRRVEGVYVARVDGERAPIPETEAFYACDTLLLSVGLIPENELSRAAQLELHPVTSGPVVNQWMQTSRSAIFAGGNVLHVNDLVDNVSRESEIAGRQAARYAMGKLPQGRGSVACVPGENVRYICPQRIELTGEPGEISLYFRVAAPARKVTIVALQGGRELARRMAPAVNSGEMERIPVQAEALTQEDLVIHVREGTVP